jgi:hypothetical protein
LRLRRASNPALFNQRPRRENQERDSLIDYDVKIPLKVKEDIPVE